MVFNIDDLSSHTISPPVQQVDTANNALNLHKQDNIISSPKNLSPWSIHRTPIIETSIRHDDLEQRQNSPNHNSQPRSAPPSVENIDIDFFTNK